MKAIISKEIQSFLSSMMGYLVWFVFLLVNGLFLWILPSKYNILQANYNSLQSFFDLEPFVMLFLVSALTMRSFSEELKQGTLELLFTKPLSVVQIVLGKFFAVFSIVFVAILPTILYAFTLNAYSLNNQYMDMSELVACYFGLMFLIASYISIGIFFSTITQNQLVAFLLSVVFCSIFYLGFNVLEDVLQTDFSLSFLSMQNHYQSMSRAVLDSRDIIYFISLVLVFLYLSVLKLNSIRS